MTYSYIYKYNISAFYIFTFIPNFFNNEHSLEILRFVDDLVERHSVRYVPPRRKAKSNPLAYEWLATFDHAFKNSKTKSTNSIYCGFFKSVHYILPRICLKGMVARDFRPLDFFHTLTPFGTLFSNSVSHSRTYSKKYLH